MKTQEIEFKEVGGSYDGNLVITRDSSGMLVITTPGGTVKIKDGLILLSGNILLDGGNLGLSINPDLIKLIAGQVSVTEHLHVYRNIYSGTSGINGIVVVKDSSDASVITLQGSTGDGIFKGGLNVGTATGAAAGVIRAYSSYNGVIRHVFRNFSDGANRRIDFEIGCGSSGSERFYFGMDKSPSAAGLYLDNRTGENFNYQIGGVTYFFFDTSGNATVKQGLNVGTASGATTGQIRSSNNITSDTLHAAPLIRATPQTASLPTPTDALCGTLYCKRDAAGIVPDRLYCCLRDLDSTGYTWVQVATGP